MFIKIFLWLRGYLLITMKGRSPERFINLCNNNNIYIWNLNNIDGYYRFQISIKDYKKLKAIAKKTHTIPFIEKKIGLPFILYPYKKRKAFITGIIFFCALIYLFSLHIWNITIEGGQNYTEERLIKYLKEENIYIGKKVKDIDCRRIEENIREDYTDIGWVSAEIKGTNLIIKIKETVIPSPAISRTNPSHIIAKKDGIISKMVTRTGTPLVELGDVVKKGDILVSGVVDIVGDNEILLTKEPVAADADVAAKTYYKYEDSFPTLYTKKEYTGKIKSYYHGRFILKEIKLFKHRIPYEKYDIMTEEYILQPLKNFYLPFRYYLTRYNEYIEVEKTYSEEEAIALAKLNLNRELESLEEKGVLIIENNVKIEIKDGICLAKGNILVEEDIIEYKEVEESEWRIIEEDELNGGSD